MEFQKITKQRFLEIYISHILLEYFIKKPTQFIGFKNYGDEYKLMGLSAYGNNKYENVLSELVT